MIKHAHRSLCAAFAFALVLAAGATAHAQSSEDSSSDDDANIPYPMRVIDDDEIDTTRTAPPQVGASSETPLWSDGPDPMPQTTSVRADIVRKYGEADDLCPDSPERPILLY